MSPLTFDPATLLTNFVAHLRNNNIARRPQDNSAPALPPAWVDPRLGVPYPGQRDGLAAIEIGQTVVLGVYPSPGIPSRPFEGFYRQDCVVVVIRAAQSPLVRSTFESIRDLLHDQRNYQLNELQVNQSMLYRDLTRRGSDKNGFAYDCEFIFDLWGVD